MSSVEATVALHQSRNRVLLESLAGKGADPFEKRRIDLHFLAGTDVEARNLAEALRVHGFSPIAVSEPAIPGSKWSVEAQLNGSIMEVTAVSFVERYAQLAAQHCSEFDGWGTSV